MICVGRDILFGTLDDLNPLAILRGNALVLSKILDEVTNEFIDAHVHRETPTLAWKTIEHIQYYDEPMNHMFPPPTGININMMPIILYGLYHNLSIPNFIKGYIPMIARCKVPVYNVHNNDPTSAYEIHAPIGYLTISEQLVPINTTHRRAGLHIERPGTITFGGTIIQEGNPMFGGLAWGMGCIGSGIPIDGIFMASNVANTCRIFSETITKPEEIVDAHGGLEQVRCHLGAGTCLGENELVWFTDRTPHESLPMPMSKEDPTAKFVHRQFFRLVVGRVSVWYAKHNTINPNGTQPDAIISYDDKFA